jgi:glucose-1-phosphate adenylyltransferase
MKRPKVLALILAGGKGGRLGALTKNRAKPVMPFAGTYRLIDFALSNCRHSRISDVWIIEQYQLHSLNEHLSNGRPWDLDKTYGGLQILPPNQGREENEETEGGYAEGNADAIYRHRSFIREFNPDILLVLSADHVYKLDFRDVIDWHLEKKADVTMVTTKVPPEESASRFGVVKVDDTGRVTDFAYKPDEPEGDVITTEVFVYNAPNLLKTLDALAENGKLQDFGHELIPKLVENGKAFEFRFEGYWRDVGTIESYWLSNMDLLDEQTALVLDDPEWTILTFASQRVPAAISETARISQSLISNGCKIRGTVLRSVLAPGVVVEEGAEIVDSVVLPNAIIRTGAKVSRAIVDNAAQVSGETKGEREDKSGITIFVKTETTVSESESIRVAGKS